MRALAFVLYAEPSLEYFSVTQLVRDLPGAGDVLQRFRASLDQVGAGVRLRLLFQL
jgi:hypothetical protein